MRTRTLHCKISLCVTLAARRQRDLAPGPAAGCLCRQTAADHYRALEMVYFFDQTKALCVEAKPKLIININTRKHAKG